MTDKAVTVVGIATSPRARGVGTATVCLFSDGTLKYTHRMAVTSTSWRTESVDTREDEGRKLTSVSLSPDGDGHLIVTVGYDDGRLVFAVLEPVLRWQRVNGT